MKSNHENKSMNEHMKNKDLQNENEQKNEKDKENMEEQKGGKQNNGNQHANQYTSGRNDDRGRKE